MVSLTHPPLQLIDMTYLNMGLMVRVLYLGTIVINLAKLGSYRKADTLLCTGI